MSQRRLTAILAADVVGYSRLMGEDEAGTLAALKAHRNELFDPEIASRGGRTVKLMGDGVLVEFPSVVDAVEAAISVQRTLAEDLGPIKLRMGINLGDVIVDGDEIYGDGVNVAARLETEADTGGICISSIVHESVRNRVTARFEDAGLVTLKNIDHPQHVYKWSPLGDRNSPVDHVRSGTSKRPVVLLGGLAVLIAVLAGAVGFQLLQSGDKQKNDAAVASVAPEAGATEPDAVTTVKAEDAKVSASVTPPRATGAAETGKVGISETGSQVEASSDGKDEGAIDTSDAATSEPDAGAEVKLPADDVADDAADTRVADQEPAPSNEPEQVTDDDIVSLLVGRTLRGGREFGGDTFELRLGEGGNFRGEIKFNDAFGSGGVDSGRWVVRGGTLCVNFSTFANGRKVCAMVVRNGNAVSFKTPDGRDRPWTLATP